MKSSKLLAIVIVSILPFGLLCAQQTESRFWLVEEIEIKPKKINDFELSLKELAVAFGNQNYPYSYLICKDTDDKYYKYTNFPGIHELDQLKAITKNTWDRMDHKVSRQYNKCVSSSRFFVIKDLPEFNYIPENPRLNWEDVTYAIWEIHMVESKHIEAYLNKLKNFQELKSSYDYNDPSFIFQGVEGFELPTYIFLSYGADKDDRIDQDAYLWKVTGNEGHALFEKLFPLIKNQQFISFWLLKELSYEAAIVEENL